MDYLSERNLVREGHDVELLGNSLVLIAPDDSDATLEIDAGFRLAGALGDGRLAMAHVDAVPAGKYAKAALTSLGVWDEVADQVAQAENVRAALALVATRRSAARHRLRDRRDGRTGVQGRRRIPRGQPPADRLPGGVDRRRDERRRGAPSSSSCAAAAAAELFEEQASRCSRPAPH